MTFAFASINVMGDDVADDTRVVKLELQLHDGDLDTGRQIKRELAHFVKIGGGGWCNAMVERLPVLLETIEMFEVLIKHKDDRHRLNMATLLGGCWTALHGRKPSEQEAAEYIGQATTTIAFHGREFERDEAQECFDRLLASTVRSDYPHETRPLWYWSRWRPRRSTIRGKHMTASAEPTRTWLRHTPPSQRTTCGSSRMASTSNITLQ